MNVHFLGTAAFEGIPSLFCQCDTCKQAQAKGGKNIRTRTSVMIDGELKIDFPPDTCHHAIRDNIDMDKVKDLIFTHSHSDHLYAEDMLIRMSGYAKSGDRPIHVYGHDLPIRSCIDKLGMQQDKYRFHVIRPFEPVQTQTATIVPLIADHDRTETCLVYYIEKDGKTIFYGHDSGWFPEQTWEWLKGKKLDLAILECTTGRVGGRINHMNVDCVLETKEWLIANDIMNPGGKFAVTHFSHNAHLLHEDLMEIFEPNGITVAYDGMRLEL
ncbi:MBL fold metallo-hydrolase [Paenibacillus mendelii]|uniref:MBL fold metallo-hydrolase n=1 Tax=Paenibacillus mendelii TaxID=206163 RepID=A0ABV6J7R1_9BACL|nr:MBL fold metallo-hydrolase [Paenibacillus mendelii]MCQ6561424.1 MBL fold metallo-hydrolase [Paenibacillus mendelii]